MGLFDRFKKKEPDYDPGNITIRDLKKGFFVDYDLQTWEVNEAYSYDWGDNYFTKEFQLTSASDQIYLHIDENDDLELTVAKKVKLRVIDEDLPEEIVKNEHPPKKINFKGKTYYRDGENQGYFSDKPDNDDSWTELISWDYYDEEEENFINIEQWGEREFEASYGVVAKEFQFSNIIPR